jgi:integrative and conjugative element protein (TIGR02256 family)
MSVSRVLLDDLARALIADEAGRRQLRESGGALFGFKDGEDTVIACAYGPGPRARHRRAAFEPHTATTQLLMDAVRESSDARYRYLGSWHSHPGGLPRPSGPDIETTERVASEPHVLLPDPLVLIQATRPGPEGVIIGELRAWRWEPDARWLMPCRIESIDLEQRFCPRVMLPAAWHRRPQVLEPEPTS